MTKDQLSVYIAAIVTTLAEVKEAPTGHIYSNLMSTGLSHSAFMTIQAFLVSNGFCTLSGNVLRLTDSGNDLANTLNQAIAA